MSTRKYEFGRQGAAYDDDDYDDYPGFYQNHDFGGAGGFSFGGVKAERCETSESEEYESEEESEELETELEQLSVS